jgi:hypothetical protein
MAIKIKVRPDQFEQAFWESLQGYRLDVLEAVNKAMKSAARQTAKYLKTQGHSYRDRTGNYTKGWTYSRTATSNRLQADEYRVHQKGAGYRLTHLLENGHRIRGRDKRIHGSSRSYVHILPASEFTDELIASEIYKEVRKLDS